VLHWDRPGKPVRLEPHDDARYVAVSPDGRWIATGTHGASAQLKVWEADTGRLVRDLPAEGMCVPSFSPDGRWLAATGRGCRLWAVPSWQPGLELLDQGKCAFSPDGRLLAVETGQGAVRLIDPSTGREYARLEDPDQDRADRLCFSPDGTKLVAVSNDSFAVHVWDLRIIRNHLDAMDLDWDLPAYPPAPAADATPLSIEVKQ
jgi:WD40 repeat protein